MLIIIYHICMPRPKPLPNFQVAIEQQHRLLPIDGVINFRDLGGYQTHDGAKVKFACVYRSAQLSGLTPQGIQQSAALGIKSIMDLRFDDEIRRFPTVKQAFPDAEIISWQHCQPTNEDATSGPSPSLGKGSWRDSLDSNDADQVREAMRINYPQKLYSHRHIYKNMLMRISQGQSPLLFHCAAGKDRTGVAAALILSLVGVSDAEIIEDYLISAEATKGLLDVFHAAGAATAEGEQDFHSKLLSYPKHIIQAVFDADPRYITTLLDYVNVQYGSFHDYAIKQLDFGQVNIDRLKDALVV